jgi:hypothetical protein
MTEYKLKCKETGETSFVYDIESVDCDAYDIEPADMKAEEIAVKQMTEIEAIRRKARETIEKIAPIHRQLNDIQFSDEDGVTERRNFIKSVRSWSNDLELQIVNCETMDDIGGLMEKNPPPDFDGVKK